MKSGPWEAAEKGLILGESPKNMPQGLKPIFIISYMRHD